MTPHLFCIDSTVILTASQFLDKKTIFALIGESTATECQLVNFEHPESQSWEKLELIKSVSPNAQSIGILLCGYGPDPQKLDIPIFGSYVLLTFLDAHHRVQFRAYKRNKPSDAGARTNEWIPSEVSVESDPASRIAVEQVVGGDKRLALQLLKQDVSHLMETVPNDDSLEKFTQLRKIPYLKTNDNSLKVDSSIPPEEVSYEMLRQLTFTKLP